MTTEVLPPPVKEERKPKPPSTYITGHCSNGNCEGTVTFSSKGERFTPCRGVYQYRSGTIVCTHKCHKDMQMIRDLLAQHRPAEEPSSDSSSDISLTATVGDVTLPITKVTFTSDPLVPSLERNLTGIRFTSPTAAPTTTPSGRLAKGQLEEQVRKYLSDLNRSPAGKEIITTFGVSPKVIAFAINKEKPPSQGAVYAILEKWSKVMLVNLATKPFRFIGFTVQGERQLGF